MQQSPTEKLIRLTQAAMGRGIVEAALEDALRHGAQAFAETTVDERAARQWAEGLRTTHPHYFGQPASGTASPTAREQRRPQPLTLTPAQTRALAGLSPTQRLTQYRELQQRQARATDERRRHDRGAHQQD